MRILINDHAGHPFEVQLSRSLASRSHEVLHTFTAALQTPRGVLQRNRFDPATFAVAPLVLSEPFNRYGVIQRFRQEKELGGLLIDKIKKYNPDVVVSANTPLGTQAMLINECRSRGASFVFWLQDLLGVGIRNNLNKKLPYFGSVIGSYYMRLERKLLRSSKAVVVITEDFVPLVRKSGVSEENIHVIHNWAPLGTAPVKGKNNIWACKHGLAQTFNFVYTGTLGMKHNPQILVELALAVNRFPNVRVVVITEGLGADFLAEQKSKLNLYNLVLLSFQPFEQIPLVQAAADVLIAILEPDAGVFAVPSKVLTYLCSQRPLLLAVPPENLAARIVEKNQAGIVVFPTDLKGFIRAAERLLHDRNLRQAMAENGRRYAEDNFDIEGITNKFETIIFRLKR